LCKFESPSGGHEGPQRGRPCVLFYGAGLMVWPSNERAPRRRFGVLSSGIHTSGRKFRRRGAAPAVAAGRSWFRLHLGGCEWRACEKRIRDHDSSSAWAARTFDDGPVFDGGLEATTWSSFRGSSRRQAVLLASPRNRGPPSETACPPWATATSANWRWTSRPIDRIRSRSSLKTPERQHDKLRDPRSWRKPASRKGGHILSLGLEGPIA